METKEKYILSGVAGIAVIALVFLGVHSIRMSRAMASARLALDKGFIALAVERLEPIRAKITTRHDGCSLLMDIYFAARHAERLEWAAEACMESGKETPDTYAGLAASYELRAQDAPASQILQAGIKKFETNANLYWRLGQLLRRNKNSADASKMIIAAVERAPDNQRMALDALQYFIEVKNPEYSKLVATRLRGAKTDSPEIKLIIARGLKQGGDEAGAKTVAQEALPMMASLAAPVKTQLQEAYKDVMPAPSGK